ncbi:MAG TPA: gfo/Idh/MocA family oxidoreductase [Clostridiales bacterium]|nr:gfo/Idh/MocA family oxidoreductase [Clostridiales bacterium]
MKQLRVAILGQGRSGWSIHGRHFLDNPDQYKVVAVAEPIEQRRLNAQKAFGCQTYDGYEAILDRSDIDLVVNCTPSHLHVPVSEQLINRGFNVLCEKPLARRAEDVDRLISLARQNGVVFAVFQQSRYDACYRKVREIIDSGILGRIVQISIAFNGFSRRWDWQCIQRFNGGNLLNTGPHPLDQALQLFGGDDLPAVHCRMDRANTSGDAEDYVKLILSGPGHPVIDLEISSCCAFPGAAYTVQGTCGGLKSTAGEAQWKYFIPGENAVHTLIYEPISTDESAPAYCREQLTWHEGQWRESDQAKEVYGVFANMTGMYYQMLYRTLTADAPLEVTLEQVRRQIAVIEECHRQNPLSRWA